MAEVREPVYPVEVHRNYQGTMRVLWSDGHESRYAYAELRKACPCATCREQRAQQQQNPFQILTSVTPKEVEPVRLSAVGNYALSIEWSDGHRTGIYPWELLRALCPCPQCRPSSAP
ncbi:MAG: hypothetical protein KatS3mg131_3196 [Candidatus Tectimicrobiota bacterium]|nr:MAG: hypothetical protein KatS3mg131_3196 [Candidatus Tectomicrobia bacterium]